MYIPLGIKTDYSLLSSLIKIKELPSFFAAKNINTLGILDDNLWGVIEFYDTCVAANIKPIVGLKVLINEKPVYLYAKNYLGYQNLLKINTIISQRTLLLEDLFNNLTNIKVVIPYSSLELYQKLKDKTPEIYLSYQNITEKRNSLVITPNIVFINEIKALTEEDSKYLPYLAKIKQEEYQKSNYNYYLTDVTLDDEQTILKFIKDIDLKIDKTKKYIPVFDSTKDSKLFLKNLCYKGLAKRLNGNVPQRYLSRLEYELSVINNMGFTDYFLIVYDYVKYAKNNDIMVGPGRGSAAGSLVSYTIGITNIDPLKYDLLFERFLNPDRVTMPDIDVDFEDVKREEVVDYVRKKYGPLKVAPIMTYGTLASKQVLKDVSKALNGNQFLIESFTKNIDSKITLKDNLKNKKIIEMLKSSNELKNIYKIAMKLEGLKRHTSTHAAGVVIYSVNLDDVIPILYNGDVINTGITGSYLEELGFLKMDFLAISNLTVIHNATKLIGPDFDINKINLNDNAVFKLFCNANTDGVFQYESNGMKAFLKKLKPQSFNDLVAAVALFRPGPMDNIDNFIARKEKRIKVIYPDDSLEPILKDTYGIIVYQEQIMQILVKMAGFTFAEADNIRRAMSKKKLEIIKKEEEHFLTQSVANGYSKETALNVYELILKFANYGFNKAHSVSYALVGYQMAYLKVHYPLIFIANLLNMSINSETDTKKYLDESKKENIYILKPDVNLSLKTYKIGNNKLRLPLSTIKNVGINAVNDIINEREKNGLYKDFFDFVLRNYGKSVNKRVLESLIDGDAFHSFNLNHRTLKNNIERAIGYSELVADLDDSLVEKPIVELYDEYPIEDLMKSELNSYGFYLTNHPASRYNTKDIMKINHVKEYFNKHIKTVVLITNIKKIKTKKNEDMAFLTGQDETGIIDFTLFPKQIKLINNIKNKDLVLIIGIVEKLLDKYQINILNIEKVGV